MEKKSYQDLEICKKAFLLGIKVHKMTLTLPKYELYEQGSQVRRSSKSITSNIVEGYGRKRYKADFIRLLIYAQSSCDETLNHLQSIIKIHNFENELKSIVSEYQILGKQLYKFILYVEKNWNH